MALITRLRVCNAYAALLYKLAQNGEEGYIKAMDGDLKPLDECTNGFHRYVNYHKHFEYVDTTLPFRVKLVAKHWRSLPDATERFTGIINNDIKKHWSTLPVDHDENGDMLDVFCFESRNDAILFRFKITG